MWKAQQQHVACSRLVAALEHILKYTSSLEFQNVNCDQVIIFAVLLNANILSNFFF